MQTIFGRDVISSRSPPKHPITLAQTVLAHRNSPNFKGGSAAAVPGAVSTNPRSSVMRWSVGGRVGRPLSWWILRPIGSSTPAALPIGKRCLPSWRSALLMVPVLSATQCNAVAWSHQCAAARLPVGSDGSAPGRETSRRAPSIAAALTPVQASSRAPAPTPARSTLWAPSGFPRQNKLFRRRSARSRHR